MPGVAVAVAASPVAQAGGAGGGALEWWQGYSAPALLVYDAWSVGTLAAAKVNLANPGTYDLTEYGVGAAWSSSLGFALASGGGLHTGYTVVPSGGGVLGKTLLMVPTQWNWTSRLVATETWAWGNADCYGFGSDGYGVACNGGQVGSGGTLDVAHVIVGLAVYSDGSYVNNLPGSGMTTSSELGFGYIGGRDIGVARVALFDGVLSAGEVATLSALAKAH